MRACYKAKLLPEKTVLKILEKNSGLKNLVLHRDLVSGENPQEQTLKKPALKILAMLIAKSPALQEEALKNLPPEILVQKPDVKNPVLKKLILDLKEPTQGQLAVVELP